MFSPKNCRILVVDDLADNIFLLQTILEAEGYTVDTANSGISALARIKNSPPDLVLLDVMMPDMNGYEVTQRIRQNDRLPFIPIMLVTAHEEATVRRSLAFGANDFIRKPIDFDDLLKRVKSFLQPNRNEKPPAQN